MKINNIKIKNFKSIEEVDFRIKKYGNSYTTMFVGINESGKSNILEAMSFLNTPSGEYNYYDYCNQKKQGIKNNVDIYFDLEFINVKTYLNPIKERCENGDILYFEIENINKNTYLNKDKNNFQELITFDLKKLSKGLFIKIESKQEMVNGVSKRVEHVKFSKSNDEESSFEELTEELFKKHFNKHIEAIIKKHEPEVTFWKATEEYLIAKEDLNEFASDIDSNKALKNIFLLAGYDTDDKIQESIKMLTDERQRSILQSKLNDELGEYIKKVWRHDIDIVIEITETAQFSLLIKDQGEENKHDRLAISGRSEGARHFLSLILSLSIENNKGKRKGQLILIDEPEAHLHPSGIRDLRKELLKIGEENYVFIATHSPFLIDKQKKERNIIIKKNDQAITQKREIEVYENFVDDEVLRESFGLEVYKDLLNPHSVLVEGKSDKVILQKAFTVIGLNNYSITNGYGSNTDTLAAKLNDTDISILVVVDDDKDGKEQKEKIIKIGGSYSSKNVFTIRDLVGEIRSKGTIEDTLSLQFIQSKFKEFYKNSFGEDCNIVLNEDTPFIDQIKIYLHQKDKYDDKKMNELKIKISEELDLPKTEKTFKEKFPLLYTLVSNINKNNLS